MKKSSIAATSVFAAVAAAQAGASGFQLLEQSGSDLGSAFAGSAALGEDASTIYFNPAGMTLLQGLQVSGGGALVSPSYKFHDRGSSAGAFTGTGDGVDGGATGVVPNLYVVAPLGWGLVGGIGVGAPFGLKTSYDVPWAGAAQSTLFDVKTLNINPSLAWRIGDTFSVGAGVNYQRLQATYERQASTLTAFSLSQDSVALNAKDHAWGWNAGVLWQVMPDTRVGLSYRSRIKYHLAGDLAASGPSAALLAANTGDASAGLTLPDTFILSVVRNLAGRWQILADISSTRWSSVDNVDIKRDANGATVQTLAAHFRNTWREALGVTYTVDDSWKLKGGIAYDQGAARSANFRLTSLPDSDRRWLSAGVQWTGSKSLVLDAGAAYLFLHDAAIYNDQRTANRGLVSGSYSGNIWVLGLQATWSL